MTKGPPLVPFFSHRTKVPHLSLIISPNWAHVDLISLPTGTVRPLSTSGGIVGGGDLGASVDEAKARWD
jgi:hypothetical protein